MTWNTGMVIVGLAALVAFAAAVHVSGLIARVHAAARQMREAMAVLTDDSLADEAKERVIRHSALRLFGHAARTALTAGLVLTAPGAVLWIGDASGFAPFAGTWAFLSSWEVIIGSAVVFAAVMLAGRRR